MATESTDILFFHNYEIVIRSVDYLSFKIFLMGASN